MELNHKKEERGLILNRIRRAHAVSLLLLPVLVVFRRGSTDFIAEPFLSLGMNFRATQY
jgi:hypothetical protein